MRSKTMELVVEGLTEGMLVSSSYSSHLKEMSERLILGFMVQMALTWTQAARVAVVL